MLRQVKKIFTFVMVLIQVIFLVLFLTSCSSKKAKKDVTLSLSFKKINSIGSLSAMALTDSSSSVSISSLKVPVRGIVLESSGSGARVEVYNCGANTNDDCLIEMASSAQLSDLLGVPEMKIGYGDFDTILLYNCVSESGFISYANATISDGSLTYYTHANGKVNTDPTAAAAISIQSSGCITKHKLEPAISVTENQDINLQLYFDSRSMLRVGFSKDSPGWYSNGCTGDFDWDGIPDEAFVCISGEIGLVGSLTAEVPIVERYLVNRLGIVGLYFSNSGVTALGGYTRRFYEPGFNPSSLATSDFFTATTPLQKFITNADSTLILENYSDDITKPGFLNINNFQRTDVGISHSSVFTNENGVSGAYTARRLD
jgi:hypothetical protein